MQKVRTIEEWMRDKERNDSPAGRRKRALIPEEHLGTSWADLEETAEADDNETLVGICQHYVDQWDLARETGDGLVVLGPPGWGKTTTLAVMAMDLIDLGVWVRFISYAELIHRKQHLIGMAQAAERMDDWGDHEKEELRIRWIERDCDALFLTDVGKERLTQSGYAAAELDLLVRERRNAGKVTIIDSNLLPPAWSQYNESMASFIYQLGEVVVLTKGVDHRKRKPTPVRAARGATPRRARR